MDVALMLVLLAVMVALAALALFLVLVCGIRADDRAKEPYRGPRNEVEQLTRRLLIYARPRERPGDVASAPVRDRDRRR
ncbi:hypothetical protein HII36_28615 [Nonomuraea sp. NN258]|uniref:hypothetical protein n=1 Tax=Nonomuraea antri TaxID=2730852 RepID=UPI0015691F25|nr:hypothetical protein [Nonomuraea antri]NRQ35767.1 hypothetical protein [Nonomuraea antri]